MKKLGLILCSFLTLGLLTSCNKTPEQKAEYMVKKIEKKLDLTTEQSKQLDLIAQKGLKKFKEHKKYKEELFNETKNLILSDNITENQVKEIIQNKREKKDEIINELLPDVLEFHKNLTLEQKQKVVKFMDKMKKKFGKHWKK